jgi:hypothetical protein
MLGQLPICLASDELDWYPDPTARFEILPVVFTPIN